MGMKKSVSVIFLVFLLAAFVLAGPAAAEDKVRVASGNYASVIADSAVIAEFIEQYLKMPAETIDLSPNATWAALEKRDIDVAAEIWWPNQQPAITKYVEENKTVKMKMLYEDCRQGFWVPKYVVDKYNIKTIDDLNEHTKLFDLTGDGKGDIWSGGFGWFTNDIHRSKVKEYKLDYDLFVVEQWVFMTMLKQAIKDEKPIIFYFWEPDWIFVSYDLVLIEEPKYDPAKWIQEGDPKTWKVSCEYQPAKVYTGYPSDLEKTNPKLHTFIQNLYMPKEEMFKIIADIEESPGNPKKEPRDVAKAWLKAHPEIVKDWMKGLE